jgi:membrane protease YdiL (CAAX protease family)
MPFVEESVLLVVNTALRGVGAVLLGIALAQLVRRGQWRNPLAQLDVARRGPGVGYLFAVLVTYYGLVAVLLRLIGVDPQAARESGSHDWHLVNCLDAGARIAVCVLIVFTLSRYPLFCRDPQRQFRFSAVVLVSIAAGLVIMAVSDLQLQMGKIVWRWVEPDTAQPIHPVLEALHASAWGTWGTLQLSLAAIIVAPAVEELFFRGLLLQVLWRYLGRIWLAIAVSSVAFGLIHHRQPQDVLPLVTMGVILGYVRVRYRSLVGCILVHALFNTRTIAFGLLNPELVDSGW